MYDLLIIHSSYPISGAVAGNKMIYLLCSHIGIVQIVIKYLLFYRYVQCFTMAMPFNIILILYVILCKLSCDRSKLTILYIHVHIFYHFFMTIKSVMTFLYVNKISVCLSAIESTNKAILKIWSSRPYSRDGSNLFIFFIFQHTGSKSSTTHNKLHPDNNNSY